MAVNDSTSGQFSGEDDRNRELLAQTVNATGAVIAGRRTYDTSVRWWGADGPTGPARRAVFVVTYDVPEEVGERGVYTFVTDGIERALQEAKTAAGDKNVSVMGGAEIAQQNIRAGLVDETSIHLVPVLFGSGTRLFEHLGSEHIQLESASVIETPAAYVDFLGEEGEARIREAYPGATWDRHAAIKARYDPTNLFHLNQNIPPAIEATD